MEDLTLREFKIKITGGLIIILFLLIIVFSYFSFESNRAEIVFIASTIGGAAAIFSAYYAGIQLRINAVRDRMSKSFDFSKIYIEFDTVQFTVQIDEMIKKQVDPIEIYNQINNDETLRGKIKHILVFFEVVSVAIQRGFADEYVLYQTISVSTLNYFERFRPYIMGLRKDSDTEEYFIEYAKLFNSWKGGKSLFNGKDLPKLL